MAKDINYVVVIKQLESGRYLLSFPDFEGVTTTAETEEAIQTVAANTIKSKISDMKKAGVEISEPKKMKDISGTLKEGEFTSFVSVSSFSFDLNKEGIKEGAKEITEKVDKIIKGDLKNSVPEGKENMLAIAAGVISLINTFFFSVVSVRAFFVTLKIKFFSGISDLAQFSSTIKTLSMLLMFSGIILVALAGLQIYSGFVKNKEFLKYSVFAKIGFLVVFYILLFIKIPSEAREYVSVSFFKIFLYIISIGLAYVSLTLMGKADTKSEGDMNE